MFTVMRHPVLMEDEGRTFLIETYSTREAAQAWIDAQHGEYFGPGDYFIAVPAKPTARPRSKRR